MSESAPRKGGGSPLVSHEERRRSQRVVIRIPVILTCIVDGRNRTFEASTLSVNDQGAMLLSSRLLAAETVLEIQNARTREKLNCRVARTPITSPEGYLIPIEFLAPSMDFWRISFPPANWKPGEE